MMVREQHYFVVSTLCKVIERSRRFLKLSKVNTEVSKIVEIYQTILSSYHCRFVGT